MDATHFEARVYEAGTDRCLATVAHHGTNNDWFWCLPGGPDIGPFSSIAVALMDVIAHLLAGSDP